MKRISFSNILLLLLIIVVATIIRAFFISGPLFDDGISIANGSWQLAHSEGTNIVSGSEGADTQSVNPQLPTKDIIIASAVGLSYHVFGVSDFSSSLPSVVFSLLSILLVFLIGRSLFTDQVGLVSGFLLAILPIDIFLSSTLLASSVYVLIKLLAIYIFLNALESTFRLQILVVLILISAGLLGNWVVFVPVLLLVFFTFLAGSDLIRLYAWVLVGAGFIISIATSISSSLDVYISTLSIQENLFFLPLTFFVIFHASEQWDNKGVRFLLLWFSFEISTLIVFAHWVRQDPLFPAIGASEYWLHFVIPIILLFGYHLGVSVGDKKKIAIMILVPSLLLITSLAFSLDRQSHGTLANEIRTASTISFGLGSVLLWTSFLLTDTNRSWMKHVVLMLLVAFYGFGALEISSKYYHGYKHLSDNANQAISYLESIGKYSEVQVGGEELFRRVMYLSGFMPNLDNSYLSVSEINDDKEPPAGIYILMSGKYQEFIYGLPPDNWMILEEFGNIEDDILRIYQVQ